MVAWGTGSRQRSSVADYGITHARHDPNMPVAPVFGAPASRAPGPFSVDVRRYALEDFAEDLEYWRSGR